MNLFEELDKNNLRLSNYNSENTYSFESPIDVDLIFEMAKAEMRLQFVSRLAFASSKNRRKAR